MDRINPYLAVVAATAAVTAGLVAVRASLGLATEALAYLLIVFLSAVWWGRGPSLTASLLSFLALNFFFTEPYHTLAVASPEDVVSLLVFLVVAEMTARLATRLRTREAEARQQAWEAATLYALTRETDSVTRPEEVWAGVATGLREILGVGNCTVYLADGGGRLRRKTGGPDEKDAAEEGPEPVRRAFAAGRPVQHGLWHALPLQVGGKVMGVLHVEAPAGNTRPPAAIHRLFQSFADHLAGVIERVRLQQEAAEAELLRKTDELKSALLSAVGHELRTPLASIRIAATGLQQEQVRSNQQMRGELLEMIDSEAARLSRLVNNLLDLTRIEAGVLHPAKDWHDLHELVARAVDDLHDRLQRYHVVVELPADLPLVPLDFTQIEDVLVNLLDNSVRHSPEGTMIRVSAATQESAVMIEVENEGPPVTGEEADQIFTRFYRGGGDRRGLGIGLTICKELVEAHGGRIWVERPGAPGARFAFTLPLATPVRPSEPAEAQP